MLAGGKLASVQGDAPMGTRTDPQIILITPVGEVVAALRVGARVVGDLVGRQAGVRQQLAGHVEELGSLFLGKLQELAAPARSMEAGALFDGQLVERDMIGRLGEGAGHLRTPRRSGLAGPGIDQVEGKVPNVPPGQLNRPQRLGGAVLAAEKGERFIIECLHADRHSIDPGGGKSIEVFGLARGGVGF